MNSMENFFNWVSKPIPKDEVIIWFNVHNMVTEKIQLYGDIFQSLNQIITDTYLGDDTTETKITISEDDKLAHFEWSWKKALENFKKENINIKVNGEHKDYFSDFFSETYYNQKEKNVKQSIPKFISDIFDINKEFSKSDLDILTELYKLLEKNIN